MLATIAVLVFACSAQARVAFTRQRRLAGQEDRALEWAMDKVEQDALNTLPQRPWMREALEYADWACRACLAAAMALVLTAEEPSVSPTALAIYLAGVATEAFTALQARSSDIVAHSRYHAACCFFAVLLVPLAWYSDNGSGPRRFAAVALALPAAAHRVALAVCLHAMCGRCVEAMQHPEVARRMFQAASSV